MKKVVGVKKEGIRKIKKKKNQKKKKKIEEVEKHQWSKGETNRI